VQGNITPFAHGDGKVFVFFDLVSTDPNFDKEAEKEGLFLNHRSYVPNFHKKHEEVKQEAPQEGFINKMAVQVLVDKDNLFYAPEETMEDANMVVAKAGLKEVTVARVSMLCWVYHICRAVDCMFKGKNKIQYRRHIKR